MKTGLFSFNIGLSSRISKISFLLQCKSDLSFAEDFKMVPLDVVTGFDCNAF